MENCCVLSSPAATPVPGDTEVFLPCQGHLGDAALGQLQDCAHGILEQRECPGWPQLGEEAALWDPVPMGRGLCAPGPAPHPCAGHRAAPHTAQGFSVYYVAGFQGGITAQSLEAF